MVIQYTHTHTHQSISDLINYFIRKIIPNAHRDYTFAHVMVGTDEQREREREKVLIPLELLISFAVVSDEMQTRRWGVLKVHLNWMMVGRDFCMMKHTIVLSIGLKRITCKCNLCIENVCKGTVGSHNKLLM